MQHCLCSPLTDKSGVPICSDSLDFGVLQGADASVYSRRVFQELGLLRQNADLSLPDTKPYSQHIQQPGRFLQWIQSGIPRAEGPQASAVAWVSTTLLQ